MTAAAASSQKNAGPIRPSRSLLRLFSLYLYWYVGRHFHGLRVAHSARFPLATGPLIVYLNHASWWDPLTCILLSRYFQPATDHYAPMDALALERYRFMRHLGLFPVELGTARGAAQFLRAANQILLNRHSVLWITPQGSFSDIRTRPVTFRAGLSSLAARLPQATILPIAIEYTFWNERLPEILVNIGEPLTCAQSAPLAAGQLESSLTAAQDELAALSLARDSDAFDSVLSGAAGTGGLYQLMHRLQALATGRAFNPEHGSIHRS